jgi:hypothetical protein
MRRIGWVLLLTAPFLIPALPLDALASGVEFQVNSYTDNSQNQPHVAMDPSGNFVVVWDDDGRDSIVGQIFDSTGASTGGEFRVSTDTSSLKERPRVAIDGTGNFVVVWRSLHQDGDSWGVFGQRFDSTGSALGDEFRVNSYTTGSQTQPAVGMDGTGRFVVAWEEVGYAPSGSDIFLQRYDALGDPNGSAFQVNSYTTISDSQAAPEVAMNSSGEFVVVWIKNPIQYSIDVYGQRFDSTGAFDGPEFRVNASTGYPGDPHVALNDSGEFIVVWSYKNGPPFSNGAIAGQRFDSAGAPEGGNFRVSRENVGYPGRPTAGINDVGEFVVAWHSGDHYSGWQDVFGRSFDMLGRRAERELRLNVEPRANQGGASVGMNGSGDFVVAWGSNRQDGSYGGIFARQFEDTRLCPDGDTDRDSICDADDVVIRNPMTGDRLDCRPGSTPPRISWDPGSFDRFRAHISSGRNFPETAKTVGSGKQYLESPFWRVPADRWKKVCRRANRLLFIRVLGLDDDEPRGSLGWKTYSQVVKAEPRK